MIRIARVAPAPGEHTELHGCRRQKRDSIPTKRDTGRGKGATTVTVAIQIPKQKNLAKHVSVDDIDSFGAVRSVPDNLSYVKMPAKTFKNGVAKVLGESATFQDWG